MYICIALKLYERAEARCRISMLEADDGASRKRLMYVSAGALSAAPAREQKAKAHMDKLSLLHWHAISSAIPLSVLDSLALHTFVHKELGILKASTI
jgi:hypothetical protein